MGPYDHTVLDEETGDTLAPCNDCRLLTFVENKLCGKCFDEELRREEWELMHPESRCPRRE